MVACRPIAALRRTIAVLAAWSVFWTPVRTQDPPLRLEAGATLERTIAPGQAFRLRMTVPAAGHWRLGVAQWDVDAILTVRDAAAEVLYRVDSPLDQRGDEWLTMSLQPGAYDIEIAAHAGRGLAGRCVVSLDPMPADSPAARRRLEAEMAATRGAAGYAAGTPEDWRKAAGDYAAAADIWRELGETRREARAAYCAGVLYRLLEDGEPAMAFALRALPLWRAAGDRFREAATHNEIGLLRQAAGALPEARAAFAEAREIQEAIGDIAGAAVSDSNLCLIMMHEGRFADSIPCWERVIALTDRERVLFGPEFPLLNMGAAHDILGESPAALAAFERAMAAFQAKGDLLNQARTANNLGVHYQKLGRFQAALDRFETALATFQTLELPYWQAIALNNLGHTQLLLGQPERALYFLDRALTLRRQAGDRLGEAVTLNNLGRAQLALDDPGGALSRHRAALKLAEAAENAPAEALARYELGRVYRAMGSPEPALEELNAALKLFERTANRARQADALLAIGAVHHERGQGSDAVDPLERALALYQEIGLETGQVGAHCALARTAREMGRRADAQRHADAAMGIIERLRLAVIDPDLRASFFAVQRQAFELGVDLLLDRHAREPDRGHAARALTLSERARARGLLEHLADETAPRHPDLAPELAKRLAEAHDRLNGKARRQREILKREHTAAEARAAAAAVEAALRDLAAMETEARRGHPRFSRMIQPEPIDAAAMQRLADADTRLLVYSLGEARGHGWLVAPNEIRAFSVPGRAILEPLIRNAHQQLSLLEPNAQAQKETLTQLSTLLLGPIAKELEAKRLAVIPDGALHYLPFGALPLPEAGSQARAPLAESFDLTYLPSASFLALLREEPSPPNQNALSIAVFADPVFRRDDARFPAAEASPPSSTGHVRGSAGESDSGLWRLPQTSREAEAILALAPREKVLRAIGFRASRATLFNTDLSRYRFLHFATHGELDASRPRLSSLALSFLDPNGAPSDGMVRMHELYGLKLNAELVTLSGCETALGKAVHGEGLVGLTRAFTIAGARGVVASLWRVPERATAELMTRFYQAMLRDGLSPAAALRAAQSAVREQRRWRDPFYWAGFTLQGDF